MTSGICEDSVHPPRDRERDTGYFYHATFILLEELPFTQGVSFQPLSDQTLVMPRTWKSSKPYLAKLKVLHLESHPSAQRVHSQSTMGRGSLTVKPGLHDRRGKVSSTAVRKPRKLGSKGREEETEKLGLLSAGRHCLRNDLESISWEVRGVFHQRG